MKFEILQSKDSKFYFNIITNEGTTILTSRQYEQRNSVLESIISILEYFVVNMSEYELNNLEVEDLIDDKTKGYDNEKDN